MQGKHYAVIAGILGSLAAMIASLPNWHAALAPAFVAGCLGVIASALGAMQMQPAGKPPDSVSGSTLNKIAGSIPLVLLAAALSLPLAGCAVPTSIQTPQGQTAYRADQIAPRIAELQNAAIQANSTGGLSTAATRTIVTFCVDAERTLQATPNGWLATVAAGWQGAKAQLPAAALSNPAIAASVAAVDAVLVAAGS